MYETDTDEEVLPVDTDTEYITELSDDSYLSSWINSGTGKTEYVAKRRSWTVHLWGQKLSPENILVYTNKEKVKLVREGVGGKEIHLTENRGRGGAYPE